MTTRVSRQYKPIERGSYSNNRDYSNNNIPAPAINSQQGNSSGLVAGQILAQIFGAFATASNNSSPAPNDTPAVKPQNTTKKEEEETKPEEEIKKLIKDFDKQTEDVQEDLINKYNTIKSVTPNIADIRLETRLNNYLKALNAHKTELEMGKVVANALENGNVKETLENCDLKIVDEDIANASDVTTDEFFKTRENRGAGYVELYDTNGDEVIDFEEFKALEEKDSGQPLNQEEIDITKTVFDRIDKNNDGKIDSVEMASHLYAMSRIFDEGTNSTTADITLTEYCAASTEVGKKDNITSHYNGRSDELYNALMARKKDN